MLLDCQALDACLAELGCLGRATRELQHPFIQPGLKALQRARALVILMVKLVIAVGVTLYGRRMRSPGLMCYGPHFERWPQHAVGIAQNNFTPHTLLGYKVHIACCSQALSVS